jgi:hypothetical protein
VFCGLQGVFGVFVCFESERLDIPSAANAAAQDMRLVSANKLITISSTSTTKRFSGTTIQGGMASDLDISYNRIRYRSKNSWDYYSADFKVFPEETNDFSSSETRGVSNIINVGLVI